MVDFVVEIPTGKKPIILQLSDPQILDASGSYEHLHIFHWYSGHYYNRMFAVRLSGCIHIKPKAIQHSQDYGCIVYSSYVGQHLDSHISHRSTI